MSESAVLEFVQRASFVFTGTVKTNGQSALRALPPRPGLAVVQFDRGFRVNPVLGKLLGRPITVQLGANAAQLRPGEQWIFFSTGWVHGEEVAVTEVARLPADRKTEQEVQRAVAQLPELHLSQRIASAVLVVHGTVTEVERATDAPRTGTEHDPFWMRALIEVKEVLKGQATGPAKRGASARALLLFPGSRDHAFRDAPRPAKGKEAVFLLHPAQGRFPENSHIAPDPADIQPPGQLATVRRLLGGANTTPPPG